VRLLRGHDTSQERDGCGVKRYKVVSQREVLRPPYDALNTPEQQLEDFLNKQAEEGWYYKDMITSMTSDHRLGIEFVVLECEKDSY
jgi:hypothetical protein